MDAICCCECGCDRDTTVVGAFCWDCMNRRCRDDEDTPTREEVSDGR